jgi:hypothetical protein
MEEKEISEQESLQIIQQMIGEAKKEQKDNGGGWILWGWLLFAASISSYFNIEQKWFSEYFFWNAFGIVTVVIMSYGAIKKLFFDKTNKIKTYTGEVFSKLNIGFFISLIFIIVAINKGVSPVKGFALLINLYGFWILIYGSVTNFLPSIIGAFVTWAIGFSCLFAFDFREVMLLHAAAVLCGYIIPGHIAFYQFNKIKQRGDNIQRV